MLSITSVVQCKTTVSQLLTHWKYCSLALGNRYSLSSGEFDFRGYTTLYFEHWLCLWYCTITHWGRVMHICVNKLTITGSDNGLSPDRRQVIIWTNGIILLIWSLGTDLGEIFIEILIFSLKKMRCKCRLQHGGHLSRPQCDNSAATDAVH